MNFDFEDRVKGGLQLNFGGIGVELRMQERRIKEGIHVNQLDFKGKVLSYNTNKVFNCNPPLKTNYQSIKLIVLHQESTIPQ